MPVSITWSYANGGAAIVGDCDHGNTSNGLITTAKEIFLRHNGVNPITACKLYNRQYSGAYSGSASAAIDFAELLSWGDNATANGFGGFMMNMDAVGGYPAGSWPIYTSKSPANGFVCRTGVGDSEANGVSVPTATGATALGTIQAGAAPNVRFQCKMQIPVNEDTIGKRQFDQVLVFTYTS